MAQEEQDVRLKRQLARAEAQNAKVRDEAYLAGLKRELEGYERAAKGRDEKKAEIAKGRIADVKAEISRVEKALRGGTQPAKAEQAVKAPAEKRSPAKSSAKK